MGSAISKSSKPRRAPAHSSSAEGDYLVVSKIPHNGGKFLMKTTLNKGFNESEGGLYLSCDSDGGLCTKTTENDPELWRLLYTDEATTDSGLPKGVNAFRLLNTGRKKILRVAADGGKVCTVPYDEKLPVDKMEIFYLEKMELESLGSSKKSGPSSAEQYFICTIMKTYLSQGTDGLVTHIPTKSDELWGTITWSLIPSF